MTAHHADELQQLRMERTGKYARLRCLPCHPVAFFLGRCELVSVALRASRGDRFLTYCHGNFKATHLLGKMRNDGCGQSTYVVVSCRLTSSHVIPTRDLRLRSRYARDVSVCITGRSAS